MDYKPEDVQHLQNLVNAAKANHSVSVLRSVIKSAAEEASAADVIRIAEFILDRSKGVAQMSRN